MVEWQREIHPEIAIFFMSIHIVLLSDRQPYITQIVTVCKPEETSLGL